MPRRKQPRRTTVRDIQTILRLTHEQGLSVREVERPEGRRLRARPAGGAWVRIGNADRQETGRWLNNRAENSHLPVRRRELAMLRFRRMRSLLKFTAAHASVSNHFNRERSLSRRDIFKQNRAVALAELRGLCAR
ncbi:DDE-type integrase/transposase/recombinase [Maritimibacter fusiformis]|uniref:DDE domain-containing protein n=1 Tax=Maritimibacter fusiformis TaxID=2603819 RepID=A0A5D0RQQ0_9RHOB|nr:hypothetical protein FVF75_00720 [Maritimibacter fusiformis]